MKAIIVLGDGTTAEIELGHNTRFNITTYRLDEYHEERWFYNNVTIDRVSSKEIDIVGEIFTQHPLLKHAYNRSKTLNIIEIEKIERVK